MKIELVNIDDTTPECVVKELAIVLGIKNYNREKCTKTVAKFPGWKISENYKNKKELSVIARILNPNHAWKKTALLQAFSFYLNFNPELQPEDKRIGLPTSEHPESYSCCMLYRVCQNWSLPVSTQTSEHEMFNMIQIFFTGNWLPLQQNLFNQIRYGSRQDLIKLAMAGGYQLSDYIYPKCEEKVRKEYGYDELQTAAAEIGNRKIAETDLEAIVLAARDYELDFTCCSSPLEEFLNLVSSTETAWFPQDPVLKQCLSDSQNKPYLLTNPRLREKFNGKLPQNMYRPETLIDLCQKEAISLSPNDNAYAELEMSVLSATFHHGRQGNINNLTNTFWEEIDDLNHHEVVIYGITYNIDNPMTAFTYGELNDAFNNYNSFTNPTNGEIFSDLAINKLQKLCEYTQRPQEPDAVFEERRNLSDQIERIKIYNSTKNRKIDQLVTLYDDLSTDEQSRVNEVFINLLHCGMYMRNWDGEGPYPLDSFSTNFPPSEQINVDHRVTQSLITLEKSCQRLQDVGDYILDLPLMEYNRGSGIFVTISNSSEGLTIRRRIAIVRKGEDENGVTSCIRLSSNKFCATAYYYMILLGFHLPFKMSEVSHIF